MTQRLNGAARCWGLRLVMAVVLVFAAFGLAACEYDPSSEVSHAQSLRLQTKHPVLAVPTVEVQATARPAAYRELAAAESAASAQDALSVVASSGMFGTALASALCTGMEQLAKQPATTLGAPNWGEYLVGQVQIQLPVVSDDQISREVSELLSVWHLAVVTPQQARLVYQPACRAVLS